MKTFTITAEVTTQVTAEAKIEASSLKEAKKEAKLLSISEFEIVFDGVEPTWIGSIDDIINVEQDD